MIAVAGAYCWPQQQQSTSVDAGIRGVPVHIVPAQHGNVDVILNSSGLLKLKCLTQSCRRAGIHVSQQDVDDLSLKEMLVC